jgi:hypothetical protein
MGLEARRLEAVEEVFGIQAAGRLLSGSIAPWVQELGILVEAVESGRPAGAPADWQPGAVLRLPFSSRICRDGATADTAMMFACAAAWSGYKPMSPVDQTTHFLRPVNFDILADARIVRIGRSNSFGRVMLSSAIDKRPVGMVSCAYAML